MRAPDSFMRGILFSDCVDIMGIDMMKLKQGRL